MGTAPRHTRCLDSVNERETKPPLGWGASELLNAATAGDKDAGRFLTPLLKDRGLLQGSSHSTVSLLPAFPPRPSGASSSFGDRQRG